jgi:FtsP/CotA-like multicopper oxidase with cupredoxin domain
MDISRRTFLKAAFGAAVSGAFQALPGLSALYETSASMREFELSASPAKVNLGIGPDFFAWAYNGRIPGPEIRAREGEIIRVVLKNYLPEGTTVHWHGVPVPNGMDGVPGITQNPVPPGGSYTYEFEARPAGTYFYHSHVNYQLDQGLCGPLIIEPSQSIESHDREYILLLDDWVAKDGGGTAITPRRSPMGMMGPMAGGMMGMRMGLPLQSGDRPLLEPIYNAHAVNGRAYPEVDPIVVSQGDKVKVRLINASAATIYDLRLAGHTLIVTHADGRPVKPLPTDILRIGMGERYDLQVMADNPGSWLLAAAERGFGEGMLRVPVHYKGVRQKEALEPQFRPGLRFASYWDFQSLYPSEDPGSTRADRFHPQTLSGGMHSPFWTINGWAYPNSERLTVEKGDRVRLGYWNHGMMPHPMHLHGHFFNVVNPSLPRSLWILKDTVIVNPMQRVEIEFLADNPGNWFHHCHNLYHMEAGMANVVVYQP